MTKIRVLASGTAPASTLRDEFVLVRDNWNDWFKFRTQLDATFIDSSGTNHPLGLVKVGWKGLEEDRDHSLDLGVYEALPQGSFSVGQSTEYYEALSALPSRSQLAYRDLMQDMVMIPSLLDENLHEACMADSLLRSVGRADITGVFSRTLKGDKDSIFYDVRYVAPGLSLHFQVNPESRIRSNLHVLVGTNGVGKTTILKSMAKALAEGVNDPGSGSTRYLAALDEDGMNEGVFSGVQFVSWSPFDTLFSDQNLSVAPGIGFIEVGLNGVRDLSRPITNEPQTASGSGQLEGREFPSELNTDSAPTKHFVEAATRVRALGREEEWKTALETLSSDPIFEEMGVYNYCHRADKEELADFFRHLSDGHKVVLLTTTHLTANLAERTLVVLDEPEAHLHPPLLSAFTRCLTDLLHSRNAVGVVATHSPVVLQEVPSSSVWVLGRIGDTVSSRRPTIETFGEDVSILTHSVFGLEVERSGFHNELKKLAAEAKDYNEALALIDGKLGSEGRAILRALMAHKILISN